MPPPVFTGIVIVLMTDLYSGVSLDALKASVILLYP